MGREDGEGWVGQWAVGQFDLHEACDHEAQAEPAKSLDRISVKAGRKFNEQLLVELETQYEASFDASSIEQIGWEFSRHEQAQCAAAAEHVAKAPLVLAALVCTAKSTKDWQAQVASFHALKLFAQASVASARIAWADGALQAASRVIETRSLEGWPHDGALELMSTLLLSDPSAAAALPTLFSDVVLPILRCLRAIVAREFAHQRCGDAQHPRAMEAATACFRQQWWSSPSLCCGSLR